MLYFLYAGHACSATWFRGERWSGGWGDLPSLIHCRPLKPQNIVVRVCLGFSALCNSETALCQQRSDWPLDLKTGGPAGQKPQFTNNQTLRRQMVRLARSLAAPACSAQPSRPDSSCQSMSSSSADILITDLLPSDCWNERHTTRLLNCCSLTVLHAAVSCCCWPCSKNPIISTFFLFFLDHLPLLINALNLVSR